MKRYVRSNQEITNEYLNKLFEKIDWDDVDYADRMIDRIIKKELGVDRIFDQAKYINMLDEGVKKELMSLLEDPEALHAKRMKGRKKSSKKSPKPVKESVLTVTFEDYPDGNILEGEFSGETRLDALKAMVDYMTLYLDVDQIDDDGMTAEDVIRELELRNGDGCDYIVKLVDESTGEVLMDYPIEDYEEF